MIGKNVGVAMSGGVDSTIAALLLSEQGYRVRGFFMLLPLPGQEAQLQRVREVVDRLAVPLTVVDLQRPFTDRIIHSFVDSYRAGLTPNPCIHCNETIKFGLLAETMRAAGMDRIATGHYARLIRADGHLHLGRAAHRAKDQSYFLARLRPEQLSDVVFPLGEWNKEAVHRRAETLGLRFRGEESQDVCFLTEGLPAFLAAHGLSRAIGPLVSTEGSTIGEHTGCSQFTVGQRRGLGLPDATPWYVTAIDGAANRVVVGKAADLLRQDCSVHALQWAGTPPPLPWRGLVQLRSRHTPATAEVRADHSGTARVVFAKPQRAITPGQFAVFYKGDGVIGSSVISRPVPATAGDRP
ncbi:MAG: tRNA 2-thiouridine(34) synthase MnmA [Desulfobulbus sp.]|jgi:tRNA-specific 2-thiouridylase|nr:tRNA 2-thiouridine(34) synthase MnmA [Desulfobulbus sp.]